MRIENFKFERIINNDFFELPIRWNGKDFYATVKEMYSEYLRIIEFEIKSDDFNKIETVCEKTLLSIKEYHDGYPSDALITFSTVMEELIESPIKMYKKTGYYDPFLENDSLKLYRVRNVQNNINYDRKDLFHTPFNLRSKISTCRYSISGYPSLYLATSLRLCCEETKISSFNDIRIASKYKLIRDKHNNNYIDVNVIEMGIKPEHFKKNWEKCVNKNNNYFNMFSHLDEIDFSNKYLQRNYLYWYPILIACSFIRANKNDPFASEYIIPQLIMQFLRKKVKDGKIYGIRYFSCASKLASNLGFNYVFPVSADKYKEKDNYCNLLANSFLLTKPYFIHEYDSIMECEVAMRSDESLAKI